MTMSNNLRLSALVCQVVIVSAVSSLLHQRHNKDDWILCDLREHDSSVSVTTHPQRLLLRVKSSVYSVHVLLNLTNSGLSNNNFPVLMGYRGRILTWKSKTTQSHAVYQDRENYAFILSTFVRAEDGQTMRVYRGGFIHDGKAYTIRPQKQASSPVHAIRRRRTALYWPGNETPQPACNNTTTVYFTTKNRPLIFMNDISTEFKRYIVDVFMVVDYAIYSSWYDLSLERTSVNKMNDAISSIGYYFAQVASGMDMRYSSISESDFGINIRLAGIYIATTASDSSFTESDKIKSVVNGVNYTESLAALQAVEKWATERFSQLPAHDQVTLFTGNILKNGNDASGRPITIAGLSNVGAVCTNRSVAVCQEWNLYASVGTATHELGHSLGASHDGANNSCSSADQYIMATAPIPLNGTNFLHPFNFSSCSVSYFRSFLPYFSSQYRCLVNKSLTSNIPTGLPVGQYVTLDKQCQLLYGVSSFYCGGALFDSVMCDSLKCYDIKSKSCQSRLEQRAADGTMCGDQKWCYKGSCVFDSKAPSVHTSYCLSGDYKARFDDGSTCQSAINSDPGRCYQDYYKKTCCYSCKVHSFGPPGCEYGDSDVNYCSKVKPYDCYADNVRASCCYTCRRHENGLTGCMYGDKADWCSTVDSSACYTQATSSTCCAACYGFAQFGYPGCEYGDKVTWCKGYTQQQCMETANANEMCCQTCSSSSVSSTVASATTDCKQDTASYCSSISPRHCYALQKKCCRTCQTYSTRIPGCEYGDRFDSCNKTVEREDCGNSAVIDDCCYTCYRLKGVIRSPKSQGAKLSSDVATITLIITFTKLFYLSTC